MKTLINSIQTVNVILVLYLQSLQLIYKRYKKEREKERKKESKKERKKQTNKQQTKYPKNKKR